MFPPRQNSQPQASQASPRRLKDRARQQRPAKPGKRRLDGVQLYNKQAPANPMSGGAY